MLTALGDWWDTDREVLLAGPWCVPYEQRHKLASLRWRMLPSPWQDQQRFRAASVRAEGVYHRLLDHVASHLNRSCGVQEPLAYWRLLLGPWLLHFVHAVYDRYTHLCDALSQAPQVHIAVLAEGCFRTPATTGHAMSWLRGDHHYNWQLFSELVALTGQGASRSACVDSQVHAAPQSVTPAPAARLTTWIGCAQSRLLNAISTGQEGWLFSITASKGELLRLAARSGFRILPIPVKDELRELRCAPIWDERRSGLADIASDDDFERICARMLPQHLPTIYLEGYGEARRRVSARYPRLPRLLVSETGWYGNETFKYLAAEALVHGTRLATVQHGGGYGLWWAMALETLETAIGHSYLVWGWANGTPSLRNVPHPIVSRHPRLRTSRATRLLFAAHYVQRYQIRLEATASSLWPSQADWQDRFVAALSLPLRRRLVLRPPPEDDQAVRQRLCDQYPEMAIDRATTFKESVACSRITILERSGTCFLETLAMNAPTVLFWDPKLWDFRDEVIPYLEAFRDVGILWDSPESAAAHVMAVDDAPALWWNDESLQRARRAFVERFALSRRDWIRYWLPTLREELASSTR